MPDHRPRIVCFGPGPRFKGGIAQYNTALARALHDEGAEVQIVSWTQQYPAIIPREFVDKSSRTSFLDGYPIPVHYLTNWNRPGTWGATVRKLVELKPDKIIIQWYNPTQGIPLGSIIRRLRERTDAEIIFDLHFVAAKEQSSLDARLTRMALKHGHSFIVHAYKTVEELKALMPEIEFELTLDGRRAASGKSQAASAGPQLADLPTRRSPLPVLKLYHPIYSLFQPDPTFDKDAWKREHGLRDHVFLFFGFIRKYKGLHWCIRAFAELAGKRDDVSLLIVGESFWDTVDQRKLGNKLKNLAFGILKKLFLKKADDEREYRPLELIDQLGIRDRVVVVNRFVPNEEVPPYFQASDAVVLFYETATPSGVESLSYNFKLPVVAARVGHFPETIKDGTTGYLAIPGDVADMARALNAAIEHPVPPSNIEEATRGMSWVNYARAILARMIPAVPVILRRALNVRDIRFWLVFFLVIRLYGITNPPLETSHNWRQSTTLMVARNLVEQGPDVMHPRIDIAGEKTGITGMEFPLLNVLVYLVAKVFGYAHWHGRLIVLLFSTLGVWAFHEVVRRYIGDRTALYSALLLTCSLWFSHSRKVMPDVFSLSLVIGSLYFASRFLERDRMVHLLLFGLLIMLGVLARLPGVLVLVPLLPMILVKSVSRGGRIALCTTAILALLPSMWWYFSWYDQLVETYGFWHFSMGKDLSIGSMEIMACWHEALKEFWFHALRFTGFAAFLFGVLATLRDRRWSLLSVLGLSGIVMVLYMFRTGTVFCDNIYYVLPFVPVMALMGGYGLAVLPSRRWATIALAVVMIEGIADQQHDFRLTEKQKELLTLEPLLDRMSERDDLIVINSGVPTPMYFAHRKGWTMFDHEMERPRTLDSLAALGCRYAVIMKKEGRDGATLAFPTVIEDAHFRIHALRP